MSAEIIPFVPRARSRLDETRSPFRSAPQADDLVMDHADTALCEYSPPLLLPRPKPTDAATPCKKTK